MKRIFFILISLVFSILVKAQVVIPLTIEGANIFGLDAKINGASLHFILDTGASFLSISEKEKMDLYLIGAIGPKDFEGYVTLTTAKGETLKCSHFIIKEFEIGDIVLQNIDAVVIPSQTAPLLLGQSVLSRFSKYSITGNELILYESVNSDDSEYSKQIERAAYYLQNGDFEQSVTILEKLYKAGNLNDVGIGIYASALTQVGRSKESMLLFYKIFSKPGADIQEIGIYALSCYILAASTEDDDGKYLVNALSLARKAEILPLTNDERYSLYNMLALAFCGGVGSFGEKSYNYAVKALELSEKEDVYAVNEEIGALYYIISEYYNSKEDISKAATYRKLSEKYGFVPDE